MESSLRSNYAFRWIPDEQGNFMPIPAVYTGFSTDPVAKLKPCRKDLTPATGPIRVPSKSVVSNARILIAVLDCVCGPTSFYETPGKTLLSRRARPATSLTSGTCSQTGKISSLGVKSMGIGDIQLADRCADPSPDVLLEPTPRTRRGAHFPRLQKELSVTCVRKPHSGGRCGTTSPSFTTRQWALPLRPLSRRVEKSRSPTPGAPNV